MVRAVTTPEVFAGIDPQCAFGFGVRMAGISLAPVMKDSELKAIYDDICRVRGLYRTHRCYARYASVLCPSFAQLVTAENHPYP